MYSDKKPSNVLIKYSNFCKVNRNAPLSVKLYVLDRYVSSSLRYCSETWDSITHAIDIIYRSGIEISLGVRQNVSNEITYIESNKFPLNYKIHNSQLKFWNTITEYIDKHPESSLSKIIRNYW